MAEYCDALAAGIFSRDETTKSHKTKIVPIPPADAASLLDKKEVDIVGLVEVNLVNDVSGKLSFSQPVYYGHQGDPFALATHQNDVQWSSFVYWTVSAIFYAEENNITQESSMNMPMVNSFGPFHGFMMKHIIEKVGNYGDIFERNIDTLGSRVRLNQLNLEQSPQIYPFPGVFD